MIQNDLIGGIDISSLSSVTQAQLQQLIGQAAPLSNIGFTVFQAGTGAPSANPSIAQGTGGSPSITDNPRFARYIWLNSYTTPPTPYFYDSSSGNWKVIAVSSSAIVTASFATSISALNGVPISLLKGNSGYTDEGKAYFILRIAADGKAIEAVNANSAITQLANVSLESLDRSGRTQNGVITFDGNTTVWGHPTLDQFSSASNSKLSVNNINPGTIYYIMRTNSAGNVEWVNRTSDDLFAAATFTLDKLAVKDTAAAAAASQYSVPMVNGSSGVTFQRPFTSYISGALAITRNGTPLNAVAHNLGGIPDIFHAFIKCTSAENGFALNTCLPIGMIKAINGTDDAPWIQLQYTSSSVTVKIADYAQPQVLSSTDHLVANLTAASWSLYVQLHKLNGANVN